MSLTEARPPLGSSRSRRLLIALVAIFLGVAAALLALELVFRALPVREPLETQPVNAANRYMHFRPNNDVVFSAGWDFEIVNRLHVNNYGFVNDQDYDPAARSPLLAVIGDSYVEAAHVPYRDSLHGRLAKAVGERGRVYSFAASGSALSQYLAYAEFARERFQPSALVVVVIGNDFDESLLEYKSDPGFHYLKGDGAGSFTLELVPFTPSLLHRALRKSAVARYLHGNGMLAGLRQRIESLFSDGAPAFVGNVAAEAGPQRLEKSQRAVDFFLDVLPAHSGVPVDRTVLVVDGIRPQLYDPAQLQPVQKSYFAHMKAYLIRRGAERGYHVADLQPRFISRHQRDGARFEWRGDAHWNTYGHQEAAAAVIASGVPKRVFGPVELD